MTDAAGGAGVEALAAEFGARLGSMACLNSSVDPAFFPHNRAQVRVTQYTERAGAP